MWKFLKMLETLPLLTCWQMETQTKKRTTQLLQFYFPQKFTIIYKNKNTICIKYRWERKSSLNAKAVTSSLYKTFLALSLFVYQVRKSTWLKYSKPVSLTLKYCRRLKPPHSALYEVPVFIFPNAGSCLSKLLL